MTDTTQWPDRLTEPLDPEDAHPSLEEAARAELVNLWSDLEKAIEAALHGCWSTGCIHIADRIQSLTRFVGPTRWNDVSIHLLESGVWQRLHDEWGVPVEIDEAKYEAFRRYWHEEYLPKQAVAT